MLMDLLGKQVYFRYDPDDLSEIRPSASVPRRPCRPIQDYIPTSISEDVCKLIRYCQIEKGMVIIHSDAGIGKTKGPRSSCGRTLLPACISKPPPASVPWATSRRW